MICSRTWKRPWLLRPEAWEPDMAADGSEIDTPDEGTPWYLGEYFILTMTLLLGTIGYPFVSRVLGTVALKSVLTAMLLAALYATRTQHLLFRMLVVLVVPIIAVNLLIDPDEAYDVLDKLALISASLFLTVAIVAIFVQVIRSSRVTTDIIFGAVAVYLLFGAVVAILFDVIHLVDPGASIAGGSATADGFQFNDFLYFSFVSLTSVGYGDYAPVGPTARSLAMFEGVVGQLYIAILIARLVGLHTAQD